MGENPEVGSNIAYPLKDYLSPFAHRLYSFITCNPDGILIFPDGSLCLFEAKTATHHKKDDWKEGIPGYYMPQPRQYMEVLDDPRISGGYIGCCFGAHESDWVMHEYKRDWILGKKQMEIEARFWLDYIANGIVPPLSGNPDLDMEVIYGYDNAPVANGSAVSTSLPTACEALFEEYMKLKDKKKICASATSAAYSRERDIKLAITTNIPEGLTVIKKVNEVSYRISMKRSRPESVDTTAITRVKPNALSPCHALADALAEEEIDFAKPRVSFARKRTTKNNTNKGA